MTLPMTERMIRLTRMRPSKKRIAKMLPPMTPPLRNSSRARYQTEGAEKPRCGSLANSVPPDADRDAAAAHAFDAPAKPRDLKGDSGCDSV